MSSEPSLGQARIFRKRDKQIVQSFNMVILTGPMAEYFTVVPAAFRSLKPTSSEGQEQPGSGYVRPEQRTGGDKGPGENRPSY